MTARIRWEGPDSSGTLTGHVGTLSVWLYRIYRDGGKGWRLDCELPGWNGVPAYGHSPEGLQGRAETWLTGFTASLGAVFPEPASSEPVARQAAKPAFTPSAIRGALRDGGFDDQAFTVRRSPYLWGEVIVDPVAADLPPFGRGDEPGSPLPGYAKALEGAGYVARIVTNTVFVSAKPPEHAATSAPVTGEEE